MAAPASYSSHAAESEARSRSRHDVSAGDNDYDLLVRSIQTSHAKIQFRMTLGGGTPLVLLHGRFGCAAEFRSLMASSVGSKRAMVSIDLPGHGGSSAAHVPDHTYTLEGYADSVIEVLDYLGIERVGVLGRELGGHIGLEIARSFPGFAGLLLDRASSDTGLDDPRGQMDPLRSPRFGRQSVRRADPKSARPSPTKDANGPELRIVPQADDRYRRLSLSEISPTTADLAAVRLSIGDDRPFLESVRAKQHLGCADPLGTADPAVDARLDPCRLDEPRCAELAARGFDRPLLQFLEHVDRVSHDLPRLSLCLSG